VTSSEKPESSDPQKDAGRGSASTQTVDDKVSTTGSEAAASASGTDESGSTAEPTATDGGGEDLDGTDAPPPWQRGSASSSEEESAEEPSSLSGSLAAGALGGAAGAAAGGSAAGSRDTDDTQTIPKTVSDQETVRTQIPQSGRTQVSYTGAGSGSGTQQQRSSTGPSARRPSRGPRRASLQVKRFDPWSVLKLALVLSVALFFVWMIAVAVLYGVLDGMGVWDRLNGTYADLVAGGQGSGTELISAGRVLGVSAVVGAINSLLFAVALTVGAFVYNVSADLVGGVEVTLSERD
jgi:hypothetical protein